MSGSTGSASTGVDGKISRWGSAQSLVGFLVAGFGAALSFLGLRSTEVTTVLRNYPDQASLIALFLLLGVLAAVLTIMTEKPGIEKTSLAGAVGIVLALIGVGVSSIFFIPPGSSGRLSLKIGGVLVVGGIIVSVVARITVKATAAKPSASERSTAEPPALGSDSVRHSPENPVSNLRDPNFVPYSAIFIVASVIFIAISTYGALRLEAFSQRSFEAQVTASISPNASGAVVSVHVTAEKMKNNNYVGIAVRGLPAKYVLATECKGIKSNPQHSSSCPGNPCYFLSSICQLVMAGIVPPDDNGNVDKTITTTLSAGEFQDIDVQAVICSNISSTCFPLGDSGSRVDVFLPK